MTGTMTRQIAGTMAITMAGRGSRFVKAGYTRPKYEIEVLGRPLFDWSMLSLQSFYQSGWSFSFAANAGKQADTYIADRCAVLDIDVGKMLLLDDVTDGQATTALLLAEDAPADKPFAIYNIDTFVAPGKMHAPDPAACDGWVPCFPAAGDHWSFARLDARGQVVELREKVRISDHATVGLYWFSSARLYVDTYHAFFLSGQGEEKGERYVAPMYNKMITDGLVVKISDLALDDVGQLGTPEQVAVFSADPPPSAADLVRRGS